MADNVFKVLYFCSNCGKEWEVEYGKGDAIDKGWDGFHFHSHKCTHSVGCPHCGRIECPVPKWGWQIRCPF